MRRFAARNRYFLQRSYFLQAEKGSATRRPAERVIQQRMQTKIQPCWRPRPAVATWLASELSRRGACRPRPPLRPLVAFASALPAGCRPTGRGPSTRPVPSRAMLSSSTTRSTSTALRSTRRTMARHPPTPFAAGTRVPVSASSSAGKPTRPSRMPVGQMFQNGRMVQRLLIPERGLDQSGAPGGRRADLTVRVSHLRPTNRQARQLGGPGGPGAAARARGAARRPPGRPPRTVPTHVAS